MLYTFLRWCPGIIGLLLRQKLYPRYLKKCGCDVLFGRFVDICNGKETISIGSGVIVNDFAGLYGDDGGNSESTLQIGDNVFVGAGTTLTLTKGDITIKSGANLGSGCILRSDENTVIENDVLIAAFCEIGEKHHDEKRQYSGNENSPKTKITQIDSGCWIGVRAKIADGVHIGEGTIVGAHTVVCTDLPAYIIAIGNPGEVLRKRLDVSKMAINYKSE